MAYRSKHHLVIVGSPEHGVVRYARDLANAINTSGPPLTVLHIRDPAGALDLVAGLHHAHLHVTDKLFGSSPEHAAECVEALAAVTRLTVTLHDLPQASDGSNFARRIDAYARFVSAAHAVAVNSHHEAQLISEHLGCSAERVAVIPIGTKTSLSVRGDAAAAPERPGEGETRPLRVLIGGFVYPGKGHLDAIKAVASVVDRERITRAVAPAGTVIAIGAPAPGHEKDIEQLRRQATDLGVGFRVTGYLDDVAYRREIGGPGIPVAAHQHISASRSVIDWIDEARRPLVVESRYTREMAALRPGSMTLYRSPELADHLERAWRHPELTRLPNGTNLSPTLEDGGRAYRNWWSKVVVDDRA